MPSRTIGLGCLAQPQPSHYMTQAVDGIFLWSLEEKFSNWSSDWFIHSCHRL